MEDNIDLDDDDYTKSNELTEDRKNALKKIIKKIKNLFPNKINSKNNNTV